MHIPDTLKAISIAAFLVLLSFFMQSDIGINLADEGYLWYGSWRTSLGEIPLRDFRSYQPGRYYWAAAGSFLFGPSLMGLRASLAVFQVIGLSAGLLVMRRLTRSWVVLWLIGFLFLIWMFPRHKIFEHSLAMVLVYVGTLLIEKPTLQRHFFAGALAAVMVFFGESHGFSGVVSSLGIILFVWYKGDRSDLARRIGAWVAGGAAGSSPLIAMFVFIPGFFQIFVRRILSVLQRDELNLTLPVPWPWKSVVFSGDGIQIAHALSTGIFFVLLPLSCILGGLYLLRTHRDLKTQAPVVASYFAVMTYIYYTFSRADLPHLTFSMHPLLIGILSLLLVYKHVLSRKLLAFAWLTVFLLSIYSIGIYSPYYRKLIAPEGIFVEVGLHGDSFWVQKRTAHLIETVEGINEAYFRPEEGVVIVPHWPGFYPVLQRESPWWDTFIVWDGSDEEQARMISNLRTENVNWVLLGDIALDGREDLRFRSTHALVWRTIEDEFEEMPVDGLPRNYRLMKRVVDF